MKYSRDCRSILWTSAATPERYRTAHHGGADICMVDLEDSVAPTKKEEARHQAESFFTASSASLTRCGIRVNALTEADGLRDLLAVREYAVKPAVVVIPKVEAARDIEIADEILGSSCPETRFFAIIETPRGLDEAAAVAIASSRLGALLFGIADYSLSLGARQSWEAMAYARSKLINSARAGHVEVVDSPMFEIADLADLKRECILAREFGFSGKAAIHPSHLPVIHEVFSPDAETLAKARRIAEAGQDSGPGVTVVDGAMVGRPFFRASRQLLDDFG